MGAGQGRSQGGKFGDNVEELDDSVGAIIRALHTHEMYSNTLIFLTSDNGPYQEEGWANSGRITVYGEGGSVIGRLTGGKGQLFEGGIRMPGAVVWPGVVRPGGVLDTMVSTMDIFPTALAAAGVSLPANYTVDGKDMGPVLRGDTTDSMHAVFLHYCGFNLIAARVAGRFKIFWATQKWYTHDARNNSICLECCNGVNPASLLFAPATQLCGCTNGTSIVWRPDGSELMYDMKHDIMERTPLTPAAWPRDTNTTYAAVVAAANTARWAMINRIHPSPNKAGAGTCTAGLPSADRQPCCPGCKQRVAAFGHCEKGLAKCNCNAPFAPNIYNSSNDATVAGHPSRSPAA